MKVWERFLNYVAMDTQSREDAGCTPSTPGQMELAKLLVKEMQELGLEDVHVDEHSYAYGKLPASEGWEKEPCIGLIAHVDTCPDYPGKDVKPRIVKNYQGGDIELGHGLVLSTADFPSLNGKIGHDLIVTDGSTLLGADDKAGIAQILTACQQIIEQGLPHRGLSLCFCPDEEIGHGAALLDIDSFGADFGYTMDGGAVDELNYETFNAAGAHIQIRGRNVHPGSAKGIMVNAALLASELIESLPKDEIPAKTEDREGFFHLCDMKGSCASAELDLIIRDHDAQRFCQRKQLLEKLCDELDRRYGPGRVSLEIHDEYKNMAVAMEGHMDIVERAKRAMEAQGLKPRILPVRGGTDGAQLSFRGLLCPDMGTGGEAYHGPYEHISIQDMEKAVVVICELACGS